MFRLLRFLVIGLALLALPAAGQSQKIYLDFGGDATRAVAAGWECTEWHELFPDFCKVWHLDKIEGGGDLKECAIAWFNGQRFHIDWVGPTYFLDCGKIAEPTGDVGGSDGLYDPTCQIWEEVWPNHGKRYHVDGWEDANGSGTLDECDYVILDDGSYCHLSRIGLNIQISPVPVPVPVPTAK